MTDDPAPLGLARGQVVLVPYDPRWPALFERAAAEIRRACGTGVLDVEHVGSTSVPGLCAKPILDVLVTVPDLEGSLSLVPALGEIGYEFRPSNEIEDRHFFRRMHGTVRTHHLSLAEPTSNFVRVTLAFRDALRSDPRIAAEYADLKLALARRYPTDRPAYIDAKTDFVEGVLASLGLRRA